MIWLRSTSQCSRFSRHIKTFLSSIRIFAFDKNAAMVLYILQSLLALLELRLLLLVRFFFSFLFFFFECFSFSLSESDSEDDRALRFLAFLDFFFFFFISASRILVRGVTKSLSLSELVELTSRTTSRPGSAYK